MDDFVDGSASSRILRIMSVLLEMSSAFAARLNLAAKTHETEAPGLRCPISRFTYS